MAFAMPSASEAFDNTRWTWLGFGLVQCGKEDIRMPVRMGCDPMQCIVVMWDIRNIYVAKAWATCECDSLRV